MELTDSSITRIVTSLMSSMDALKTCYFAHENGTVPPLAFQVDFPRLEIVLKCLR